MDARAQRRDETPGRDHDEPVGSGCVVREERERSRLTNMPKVTYIIDGEPTIVEFQHGQVPYSHHGKPESFLDIAKNFHVPLEHACGGSCACTTCHVIIRGGEQDRKSTRLNS